MIGLDLVLDRLRDHGLKPVGSGYSAQCPGHDDRQASLSIARGDNGGIVLHCHAGCTPQAVCAALGLTLADLMPPRGSGRQRGNGEARGGGPESGQPGPGSNRLPPDAARAIESYARKNKLGKPSAAWGYGDAAGNPVGIVVRWETADGKEVRPFSIHDGRWVCRAMDAPRPLYRLRHLQGESTCWVAEGEKAAEALRALGLVATTSAGGAKAAGKTDWAPMKGRTAIIWPDLDVAGDTYAADVTRLALAAGAAGVLVIDPRKLLRGDELPVGGDAADWLEMHKGTDPGELRRILETTGIATATLHEPGPATATGTFSPIAVGTMVRAMDRNNYGTVTSDNGETCLVHFISPDGNTADVDLAKSQLATADGKPLVVDAEPPRFVALLSTPEFLAADLTSRFLVRNVLVAGQPCIIGGRSKTLKTSLAVDLVISLGTGTPFLGRFHTERYNVAFWSGESGAAVIRETAIRVADARGVDLFSSSIHWSFDLPKLSQTTHLGALADVIRDKKIQVAVIDPLYLALLSADAGGKSSDLFFMGSVLQPLAELGQATDCTLVLLHHFRKSGQTNDPEPAGLEELAQSGVAEWARQWLLLQRRSPYAGDGQHSLWLRTGGSAGHSGLWALNIDEGTLDPDTFSGRVWQTEVQAVADAREEVRREKESKKAAQAEQREDGYRGRLVDALKRFSEGETAKTLRELSGLNAANFGRAVQTLLQRGEVVTCKIEKTGRQFDGYKSSK